MNPALKWMAIVFGIGMLLVVIEYRFAAKKKEGVTLTDKQRIRGIFWISISLSLLAGAIVWMAG